MNAPTCSHGHSGGCVRPECTGTPVSLSLTVNGEKVRAEVPADLLLIDFLRENLGLTGTKRGCGEGDCGACTVLLDGKPITSCVSLAVQAEGCEVLTVEGLCKDDKLHPLQEAFLAVGAVQCGFCTPGMLLAAKALLDANPRPDRQEIIRAISGNICRCTGYAKIVEAVEQAARQLTLLRQN